MRSSSFLSILCTGSLLILTGCAVAGGGGTGSDPGTGGQGIGGNGSQTAASSSSSATGGSTSTSMSAGGSGGGTECNPPKHFCGGICVGNTAETGCYQSESCESCPYVQFGTNKCTDDGLCDFDCESPYAKSGNQCACSLECCTQADCSSNQECENGSCVDVPPPCDTAVCSFTCILQGYTLGLCQNGQCMCI